LREIIAEYGPDALSESGTISNLVKDLLPDDQQIARILIVAFGVLAAAAGGVILVNRHDPTVPAPSPGYLDAGAVSQRRPAGFRPAARQLSGTSAVL